MGRNWVDANAFEGESLRATDLEVGDSIEGTVEAIFESKKYEGTYFMILKNDDGELTRIFTAGNLTYAVKDGKLKPGYVVLLTREASEPGKKAAKFKIQIDKNSKEAVDNAAPPAV